MNTLKSDNKSVVRKEAFFEGQVGTLENRVKELEYDCAELVKTNEELMTKVHKLANRQPTWPKGYRPQRRHNAHHRD
jgi:hypothetical protein